MNYPNFAYIAILDLHMHVLTNEIYEAEYFLRRQPSEKNSCPLWDPKFHHSINKTNLLKPKLYESKTTSLNSAALRFTLISSYNVGEFFCNTYMLPPQLNFKFLSLLCPSRSPNFNQSPINSTVY